MSTTLDKLTRLRHLVDLGNRTKAELDSLDAKIQGVINEGGQPNVIEKILLNGVEQEVGTDKSVDLTITHPEYSIVKAEDSGDYAAVYNLTKDGVNIGATINIPKDIVVKSGSVVGNEIVLVLNDKEATEIKIPVGSLIEYVTSGSQTGDMVVVTISEDHKVTATITDGTITKAKLHTDVQAVLNDVATIKGDYLKASDKSTLQTAISDGDAATLASAKTYANSLASNYDAVGSAATAESNAKAYVDGLIAADSDVTTALDEIFAA